MTKKIIYIDMDDVLCNFSKARAKALEIEPETIYPQSQYGFFRNLEPMEEAIKSVHTLLDDDKFDVYILTAPSVLNPMCYTEKRDWVEKHLGMDMAHRLIISPHKNLNKGDYLIDDNIEGKGQERVEGTLIHFGSNDYPDWNSVMDYFYKGE